MEDVPGREEGYRTEKRTRARASERAGAYTGANAHARNTCIRLSLHLPMRGARYNPGGDYSVVSRPPILRVNFSRSRFPRLRASPPPPRLSSSLLPFLPGPPALLLSLFLRHLAGDQPFFFANCHAVTVVISSYPSLNVRGPRVRPHIYVRRVRAVALSTVRVYVSVGKSGDRGGEKTQGRKASGRAGGPTDGGGRGRLERGHGEGGGGRGQVRRTRCAHRTYRVAARANRIAAVGA